MNMNTKNQYLKILESWLENIKNVIIVNLVTILIKETCQQRKFKLY